jgi:hypothetical protein
MTVFRWISAVAAACSRRVGCSRSSIFIVADIDLWLKRARTLRRLARRRLLFWFNLEIWRRVVADHRHW